MKPRPASPAVASLPCWRVFILATAVGMTGATARPVARGADFVVTTKLDVVDDGDGVLSLREAVLAANAGNGAQNILLPAGTFTLTLVGAGEDAALAGDLDLTGHTKIERAGEGETIIDANAADRVFDVLSGARVTLSGLTIQRGHSDTGGGGVAVFDARLGVVCCRITGNSARNWSSAETYPSEPPQRWI